MANVVVDANVWISALFQSEGQYAVSRAWLDGWQDAGNGFVVPITFLVEVGCAISRKHHQAAIAEATIDQIKADVTFRLIPIDHALAESAADIGITAELRGADAIYAAVAGREGIPIVTWDKEILSSAAKVGVTARIPTP